MIRGKNMKKKGIGIRILAAALSVLIAVTAVACKPEVKENKTQKKLMVVNREDWDGDGLSNEIEINVWNTNPYDKDTDGDGYDDYTEALNLYDETANRFNPLIADIPTVKIVFTGAPTITKLTEETTGTSKTETITMGEGGTTGSSSSNSYAHSTSSESHWNAGVYLEGQIGSNDSHFKWGGTFDFGHKWASGDTFTYSNSQSRTLSQSYAESVANSSSYSEVFKGGTIKVPVKIVNESNISFNVENMMLAAYTIAPGSETEPTLIANLYPVIATAADPTKITALVPAKGESGEILFSSATLSVALMKKLLVGSGGIYTAVSAQAISFTDESGARHDFTATTTNVGAKTARLTIDYGPSVTTLSSEQFNVATRVLNTEKYTGDFLTSTYSDRSLGSILDIALGDAVGYREYHGDEANYRMIDSIRGVKDTEGNSNQEGKWFISHTTTLNGRTVEYFYSDYYDEATGIDQRYNVNEIIVHSGDIIDIAYSVDKDQDGLSLRLEVVYGTSDENKDSDGDNIEDLVELTGWKHDPNDPEGEVFITNPASDDTDGDGLRDDLDEYPLIPSGLSSTVVNSINLTYIPFGETKSTTVKIRSNFESMTPDEILKSVNALKAFASHQLMAADTDRMIQNIPAEYDGIKTHRCLNINAGTLDTSSLVLTLDKTVGGITAKCFIIEDTGSSPSIDLSQDEYESAVEVVAQMDGSFVLNNLPLKPFKILLKIKSADLSYEDWITILVSAPLQTPTNYVVSAGSGPGEMSISASWAAITDTRVTGLLLVRREDGAAYSGPTGSMVDQANGSTGKTYYDQNNGLQYSVVDQDATSTSSTLPYATGGTFYLYTYYYKSSSNEYTFSGGASQTITAQMPGKFTINLTFDALTVNDAKGDPGDNFELKWRFYRSADNGPEYCFVEQNDEWEAEPIATYRFMNNASTGNITFDTSRSHAVRIRLYFEETDFGFNPNDTMERTFYIGYDKARNKFYINRNYEWGNNSAESASQHAQEIFFSETGNELQLTVNSNDCIGGYLNFKVVIKPAD